MMGVNGYFTCVSSLSPTHSEGHPMATCYGMKRVLTIIIIIEETETSR